MISLVVQGVGGGMAAVEAGNGENPAKVCLFYTVPSYLF